MTKFMTITQIVDAARSDVNNHIASGTFRKQNENCGVDEENIFTINSLYAQWAENEEAASNAIAEMFAEEFAEYM